jgi:hypothetical protein
MLSIARIFLAGLILPLAIAAQEHNHPAPERLGEVAFPTSCNAAVQQEFNRAVALLHSFAYNAAAETFRSVADRDPNCAMAHWGIAMSSYHQLWEPPIAPASVSIAQQEIGQALRTQAGTERETGFIRAASLVFQDAGTVPYAARALNYERAMTALAAANPKDVEAQVFYGLALLANASPADKTHARQKKAAELLEPLFQTYPQHPGIAHYLIHACDNRELASRGLPAAKAYSHCTFGSACTPHAEPHIHSAWAMGRLHSFERGGA